jgi:hypothetical protein
VHPASVDHWSEIKLPLNINDDDIDEDSLHFPEPRTGCTDMTFSLIGYEIVRLVSRLNTCRLLPGVDGKKPYMESLQEMIKIVENCSAQLEVSYLQACDISRPLDWMIIHSTRVILVRMNIEL